MNNNEIGIKVNIEESKKITANSGEVCVYEGQFLIQVPPGYVCKIKLEKLKDLE